MPELNYPEFIHAQEKLNALGFKTIIPHDLFQFMDTKEFKHNDFMRHCIKNMMDADFVVTLKDWDQSKGAKMEVAIARELEMEVIHIIAFLAKHSKNAN